MDLSDFEASLKAENPPDGLSPCLLALWREGQGDWNAAHRIVQDIDTAQAAGIHAYLHRKEGDNSNAGYWYRRAKKDFPSGLSLEDEWRLLVRESLAGDR